MWGKKIKMRLLLLTKGTRFTLQPATTEKQRERERETMVCKILDIK